MSKQRTGLNPSRSLGWLNSPRSGVNGVWKSLEDYFMSHGRNAAAFARAGSPVTGFDIDVERVRELQAGHDRTREVDAVDLKCATLELTCDRAGLRFADFFIVTVPTPIDAANRPDLSAMFEASRMVGTALKKGDIVVFESTVYPGAVEKDERHRRARARRCLDPGRRA